MGNGLLSRNLIPPALSYLRRPWGRLRSNPPGPACACGLVLVRSNLKRPTPTKTADYWICPSTTLQKMCWGLLVRSTPSRHSCFLRRLRRHLFDHGWYTGTICWTGQVLPQVYKSWREKPTACLSPPILERCDPPRMD